MNKALSPTVSPIPADQRVLTGGLLTQNPGWTDSTNFD